MTQVCTWFHGLMDGMTAALKGDEVALASVLAEDSDFARFNHAKVRQAGSVEQREIEVELVQGRRHASARLTLSGSVGADLAQVRALVEKLRACIQHLPEDPHLLYNTEVANSERTTGQELLPSADAVTAIQDLARGKDLVGLYAAGRLYRGFGNSLGQRNWFEARSFNFDWSLYHAADKAVKCDYAGAQWDPATLKSKMTEAGLKLEALKRPPKKIAPGQYRVALAPAAVGEVLGLLSHGGFGLKAQRTKQSPLLRLVEGAESLHADVCWMEDTAHGTSPNFQEQGYLRPDQVPLVEAGRCVGALVSPRSAKEFQVSTNGASSEEVPESLAMDGGDLPAASMLSRLGTGVYVGNLHYLNYSDVPACRTTGMTRFATFWVEGGEIQAPLSVMRFDETVYRVLGSNLIGLTAEREHLLSSFTYERRSTTSLHVPGALVQDFAFTL